MSKYEQLKLKNQLCFPLYAASREIIRAYRPFLDELDLTYTQYVAMMVLWEKEKVSVKELGQTLFLDSGTLTPMLKAMEKKHYIKRSRSADDERVLLVELTSEGKKLEDKASEIPGKVSTCVCLEPDEAANLYATLYKLIARLENNK